MTTLRNKELKLLRSHATTLLRSRNDFETHFMESIEQVKAEIKHSNDLQKRQLQAQQNRHLEALKSPPLRTSSRNGGKKADKKDKERGVTLRDLGPDQRNRVLRLVFAKLNAAQAPKPSVEQPVLQLDEGMDQGDDVGSRHEVVFGQGGMTFLTDMDMQN